MATGLLARATLTLAVQAYRTRVDASRLPPARSVFLLQLCDHLRAALARIHDDPRPVLVGGR